MSKAILVMDMPKKCYDCPFLNEDVECLAFNTNYIEVDGLKKKPDWCPLVPMPEKKPESAAGISFNLNGSRCETVGDKYVRGWNACIDAITGEGVEE